MAVSRGPEVIRRRLGAKLRDLREQSGRRLEEVASHLECSTSKISRLENGQGVPKARDIRDLIELYEVTDDRTRDQLTRWAADGRAQGWWHAFSDAAPASLDFYIALEAESSSVRTYSPAIIYGLLQTQEYAEAVLRRAIPGCSTAQIKRLAELRIKRQEVILRDDRPLKITVVVDESAIYKVMGSWGTMVRQIDHILELIRKRSNIEVVVFPFSAGADEAMCTFTIFQPRDSADHTVVNMETTFQDAYFEETSDVLHFVNVFDDLRGRSLSHGRSAARLDKRLKEIRALVKERGDEGPHDRDAP